MSETATMPQETPKKAKPFLKFEYYNMQQVVFSQSGHADKNLQVFINEEPFGEPVNIVDDLVIVHGPYVLPKTGVSITWKLV